MGVYWEGNYRAKVECLSLWQTCTKQTEEENTVGRMSCGPSGSLCAQFVCLITCTACKSSQAHLYHLHWGRGPHNSSLHVCFGLLLWLKKFQSAASLAGEPDYGCLLCSVIIWGANSKPRSSSSVLAIRFKCSMTQLSNRRVVWLLWFVFRCCKWKQREWWLLKWCKKVKKWVIASRQSHIEIRSCKRSSVMAFKFRSSHVYGLYLVMD